MGSEICPLVFYARFPSEVISVKLNGLCVALPQNSGHIQQLSNIFARIAMLYKINYFEIVTTKEFAAQTMKSPH